MLAKAAGLTFLAICLMFCLPLIFYDDCSLNWKNLRSKQTKPGVNAVDINSASVEELEKLPKVGKVIAERIIEYRQKNGKFRRPEHLILVRGMSDKKFRMLRSFVKVE